MYLEVGKQSPKRHRKNRAENATLRETMPNQLGAESHGYIKNPL